MVYTVFCASGLFVWSCMVISSDNVDGASSNQVTTWPIRSPILSCSLHEVTIQSLLKQVNIYCFVTFYAENMVIAVLGCINCLYLLLQILVYRFFLNRGCWAFRCTISVSFTIFFLGFYNYNIRVFSFTVFRFLVTRKALFRFAPSWKTAKCDPDVF